MRVWNSCGERPRRALALLVGALAVIAASGAWAQAEPAGAAAETTVAEEATPETGSGAEALPEGTPTLPTEPVEVPMATPPQPPNAPEVILLHTSDLEGSLIEAPCGGKRAGGLLSRIAEARAQVASGGPEPVLLDAGDALFPSAVVSRLAGEEGPTKALVSALAAARYDAFAVGDATLAASTPQLVTLLGAAGAADLPVLASNLACPEAGDDVDAAAVAACGRGAAGLTKNQTLFERSGFKIGVFNLLHEGLADAVPGATLAGAKIGAPAAAAQSRVKALRGEGADLVVLISNLDDPSTAPRRTLELVRSLDEDARPDVVITAATGAMVVSLQSASGVPVLAAAPRSLARAALRRVDGRWQVVERTTVELPETGDAALAGQVQGWNSQFCSANEQPLAGGALAAELDRAAFAQVVLHAMRERAGAEIAFINRNAIDDPGFFPLSGSLNTAQVRQALPYDSNLQLAVVRGSDLGGLVSAITGSDEAIALGIGDDGKINGRDINPDGRYRVVTTAYVARGGDGIIEADAAEFEELDEEEAASARLTDQVVHWLDRERGTEPIDLDDMINLHRHALWYGSLVVDAGLTFARISDDNYVQDPEDPTAEPTRRYDQAQLDRDGLLDFRGAVEARAGFSTRGHQWDNHLQLQYGRQWIDGQEEDDGSSSTESVDLIRFRSAYDMDYLRDVVLDGAWYGPSIFLEAQLESEFYHEDEGEDEFHFLEITGLLGLKLKPTSWLRFSAAGGIRSVVLAPDPYPVPGVNLRAEIIRRRFFGLESLPVYFAAAIDYFVGWPTAIPETDLNTPAEGSAIHKLTFEARLEIELVGPLRLTGGIRAFVYDEDPGSVATAFDATAGLRIALSGHRQTH